jgi:signal peptidase II
MPEHMEAKRSLVVAAVLLSLVGCDRVTKVYAEKTLVGAGRISLLRDTVRIEYAENHGAFLGMGSTWPPMVRKILLSVGVGGMVIALLWAAFLGRQRRQVESVGLALIASGGVGNLWDRLARDGAVIDFMNLGIGPVRTGIFNVADVAIVAGAILLFFVRRPSEQVAVRTSDAGQR